MIVMTVPTWAPSVSRGSPTLTAAMASAMKAMKVAMKAKAVMKAAKVTKAMKVMKAAKAMKVMKVMKAKSVIARGKLAKASVFRGTKVKTVGGLTKDKLVKNKFGKIVSKAASVRAKKSFSARLGAWNKACAAARKALGVQGFCPMGGSTAQGKALYAKTKSLYKA
mmetsp:Transcript_55048/g.156500  ORF Transcript_55048/g.156500 Transcript_55048/m.156500 type:complete len:166 (-) Transcript_55048:180-677(-)